MGACELTHFEGEPVAVRVAWSVEVQTAERIGGVEELPVQLVGRIAPRLLPLPAPFCPARCLFAALLVGL